MYEQEISKAKMLKNKPLIGPGLRRKPRGPTVAAGRGLTAAMYCASGPRRMGWKKSDPGSGRREAGIGLVRLRCGHLLI
jgi:hypothetical protein